MSRILLVFNGAALLGCAFFVFEFRDTLLTALLLFLPLLDTNRRLNCFNKYNNQLYVIGFIVVCYLVILFLNEGYETSALSLIFLVALPEEWFFRCYFLQRLELYSNNNWITNSLSSIFFTGMHVPTQGWLALMVFFPSLLFGYLYQKSRSLVLIVLVHGLANLFYIIYLRDGLEKYSL